KVNPVYQITSRNLKEWMTHKSIARQVETIGARVDEKILAPSLIHSKRMAIFRSTNDPTSRVNILRADVNRYFSEMGKEVDVAPSSSDVFPTKAMDRVSIAYYLKVNNGQPNRYYIGLRYNVRGSVGEVTLYLMDMSLGEDLDEAKKVLSAMRADPYLDELIRQTNLGIQAEVDRLSNRLLKLARSVVDQSKAMISEEAAREKLTQADQKWGKLFDSWMELLRDKKEAHDRVLTQVENIDWKEAARLRDQVVIPGVPKPVVPAEFDVPIERIGATDEGQARKRAREEVLEVGKDDPKSSKFGVLIVSGGTGSEFSSDEPKGVMRSTPFSEMSLYEGMIRKAQAAAKYYGHKKIFPLVIMTSEVNHKQVEAFFKEKNWFGEEGRILLAQQGVMPLFDAKTNEPFLNAKGEIAIGGTGHGDAFDDILVREKVNEFLDSFGVEVMQYMNIDNQLNPLADERLIGYGQKTYKPENNDKRPHMSLGVVKKNNRDDRLGNQIKDKADGQWKHIGYGVATDVIKDTVELGDPSFRVVWRKSLSKESPPTPWRIDSKPQKDFQGVTRTVKKMERASDDTPRRAESTLVELNREDTFQPIKKPDAIATVETVATSYLGQSNYWRKRLVGAKVQTTDKIGVEIAAQEAFYMSDDELEKRLNEKKTAGELSIAEKISQWQSTRRPYELGGIYITRNWEVEFIGKHDPKLYFLNWQKPIIDSSV
ncbi:MAG: UTP--glucose-1-phosphate uridylyltransferase, partial [Candidatus Omnitrophota bacterium]